MHRRDHGEVFILHLFVSSFFSSYTPILSFSHSHPSSLSNRSLPDSYLIRQNIYTAMATAQDLFAQGSHAFAEDDYEEALNFYSQAIEVNGTHVEIFLKRYFLRKTFFTSLHSWTMIMLS